MTEMLLGTVDNGRRATLACLLYTGEVGVRDRGDGQVELAWFGKAPILRAPTAGTLDGAALTITGLRARDLTSTPTLGSSGGSKAIVATAVLQAAA